MAPKQLRAELTPAPRRSATAPSSSGSYLGPILVYALVYFCPSLAYSHLRHAHRGSVGKLVPLPRVRPGADLSCACGACGTAGQLGATDRALVWAFGCRARERAPGAGRTRPSCRCRTLALAYWTFHYAKRILETIFVHKCARRAGQP